jgi:hypothetical protein
MVTHGKTDGSTERLTLTASLAVDDPTNATAGPRPADAALALPIRYSYGPQNQHNRQRNILHLMLLRFS